MIAAVIAARRCGRCGKYKQPEEFGRNRSRRDSLNVTCRECACESSRRYRQANPQKVQAAYRRWAAASRREQRRHELARLRRVIFDHYGTACACCGSTERLSIDHVNGNGKADREQARATTGSSAFYRWLIRQGFPGGLQTLCNSCNSSKADQGHCRLDHEGAVPA